MHDASHMQDRYTASTGARARAGCTYRVGAERRSSHHDIKLREGARGVEEVVRTQRPFGSTPCAQAAERAHLVWGRVRGRGRDELSL